jgi:hypothetical protein
MRSADKLVQSSGFQDVYQINTKIPVLKPGYLPQSSNTFQNLLDRTRKFSGKYHISVYDNNAFKRPEYQAPSLIKRIFENDPENRQKIVNKILK